MSTYHAQQRPELKAKDLASLPFISRKKSDNPDIGEHLIAPTGIHNCGLWRIGSAISIS
nr:hypothetical protein [uncultured Undibacterium sp.]